MRVGAGLNLSLRRQVDRSDKSIEDSKLRRASLLHMQSLLHGIEQIKETEKNIKQIVFYVDNHGTANSDKLVK